MTLAGLQRPICLVLDFDGTLTKHDTMHLVANAGYSRQKRSGRNPQPPSWDEIVTAYTNDFRLHSKAYSPTDSERRNVNEEIEWLNSLEHIEQASFDRAREAGIFDEVSNEDMIQEVRRAIKQHELQLRPNCAEVCHAMFLHNQEFGLLANVHVLSVNWSASFIRFVLNATPIFSSYHGLEWFRSLMVHANELPGMYEMHSHWDIVHHIRTSSDKVKILKALAPKEQCESIYVGDSATDLECLLAADIGICVRDDPMGSGQKALADTCDRLSIGVLRLAELQKRQTTNQETKNSDKTLYFIKDFSELYTMLTGGN